jgi:hypothetical protein
MGLIKGYNHFGSYGPRDVYVSDDYTRIKIVTGTDSVDDFEAVDAMQFAEILLKIARRAVQIACERERDRPLANVPPSDSKVGSPA